MNQNKTRLRELIQMASTDYTPENFSDELLNETKGLIRELYNPIIEYFVGDLSFGVSKPEEINNNCLKFKIQSNLGMVWLTIDKDGNCVN